MVKYALRLILTAGLVGCNPDSDATKPSPAPADDTAGSDSDSGADTDSDTDDDTDTATDSDTDTDTDTDAVPGVPSRVHVRDYGFAHWPTNHWTTWGSFLDLQHIHTGWYALAMDVSTGSFPHMGTLTSTLPATEARRASNSLVEAHPAASVSYTVKQGRQVWTAQRFLSREGSATNPSELEDMGRFMQRIDIPKLEYNDSNGLSGSLQLAAMPRHFVLTHRATARQSGDLTVGIEMTGAALSAWPETEWLDGTRAVQIHDGAGDGWTFVLPPQEGLTSSITRASDGGMVFEVTGASVGAGQQLRIPLLVTPVQASGAEQLSVWLDPTSALTVSSVQLFRDGTPTGDLSAATYDPERGAWVVPLRDLSGAGAPGYQDWGNPENHNWYNRHQINIDNLTGADLSVPLAFEGGNNAAFYITGGSPLLREPDGGPTGIPLQISKNWHEQPFWYHLYTTPLLSAGAHTFEHTFAHSKWGEAYAASHAQLSLVGWGQNQQWDESALGAFGESVTYDPDLTLGRAMVDDVRPFLVQADRMWSWTGNVGGASFLVYKPTGVAESRPDRSLERLRTDYTATGPNLTEVTYAGVTHDGKIEAEITTQLGRTDDLVRVWYHLKYSVLQEVSYDRLALFQVASDRYADNGFQRWAYGNADGVQSSGQINNHQTTGYVSGARGWSIEGDAPWVFLFDSTHTSGSLPEHLANVGFVVRDYRADLVDRVITTPYFSMQRTFNGGYSQVAFELGLPWDQANQTIPAGSEITATVEYLVPPSEQPRYYGDSDHLTALDSSVFRQSDMMVHLASGNTLSVTADVGVVTRAHPVVLSADPGPTAADFQITGGLGYVPVTITGLARPDGWSLQHEVDGAWEAVDQAVEGNDWWQAADDPESQTFSLTFNLPNRGTQHYRLVR